MKGVAILALPPLQGFVTSAELPRVPVGLPTSTLGYGTFASLRLRKDENCGA